MARTRVLIAEREKSVRAALRLSLEEDGYAVAEAADGHETLAAIDRWSPGVLLLDLAISTLNGMGVLHELRRMPFEEKPRVIAMSDDNSAPIAFTSARMGALAFLQRPASIADVRRAIIAALAEPLPFGSAMAYDADRFGGEYAAVLARARRALRLANYPLAETLLMRIDDPAQNDAAYFNLLGIYYESRRQWRAARKFYARARAADKGYEPAETNMRRLHELIVRGYSGERIAYGDGPNGAESALPDPRAAE